MQSDVNRYDRRKNRGFGNTADDLDLEQREEHRRGGHRLSLRLWTEGRHGSALDFHNCSNLAETGMFIENPDPYPLHAMVEIEFNLPGIPDPICVTGRVVSSLDDTTAGANIMGNGFEFTAIADADRLMIRAFIDANRLAPE